MAVFDFPPWAGPQLGALAAGRPSDALLFDVNSLDLKYTWKEALTSLGLSGVIAYQLRHAGASDDA
eukprot:1068376-Alexandrium_andersonii.AAC.1